MDIQLEKKVAEMVLEIANGTGLTEDEVVNRIVEWFVHDMEQQQ